MSKLMDIRRIDLNLLIAFDVLMDTRNVSQAAQKLHVGQSAMSHSLKRLRELIDDPLLVRVSRGMVPTSRALELVKPIRAALSDLQNAFSPQPDFVPHLAENCFNLVATDYIMTVLLPALIERVKQHAPKVSFVVHSPKSEDAEARLERGDIDLILDLELAAKSPSRLHRHGLFKERLVVLVRKGHPALARKLTVKRYLALDLVCASSAKRETLLIDDSLLAQGINRKINLMVPHFFAVPSIIEQTDMAVTLPYRVAKKFATQTDLQIIELPQALPDSNVEMAWHPLRDQDPAHIWLRTIVLNVAASMAN